MDGDREPLFWLSGAVETPPFDERARIEAGRLLGQLQEGDRVGMPLSRPMPGIGTRCHELRVRDDGQNWRIIDRIDDDAVVVVAVFAKTTRSTPKSSSRPASQG